MRIINSDIGEFYLKENRVYTPTEELKYIDEGEESLVYQYNDKALKIYRDVPRKKILSEEMIDKLKKIPTKRIILPKGKLYEEEKLKGFYMPYVEGNRDEIYYYKKEKLVEELKRIYEDLKILGKESIVIDDLRISNFLCNEDSFYLIDAREYHLSKNIKDTTKINIDTFRIFIFNDIIAEIMRKEGKKENIPLREIFGKFRKEKYKSYKKYEEDILEYLIQNMESEETLSSYGKRLIYK